MNSQHTDTFSETARQIGLKLMRDAIWDRQERCTWLGNWFDGPAGNFGPVYRSFGADLYAGSSGIVYFLCRLYQKFPDPALAHTISGGIQQVLSLAPQLPDHGFYSGKPGAACVVATAGHILQNHSWLQAASAMLQNLRTENLSIHETDVISGIAGSIPALRLLNNTQGSAVFTAQIRTLADALCYMAVKDHEGWSWPAAGSKKNLTGFSHGAAGMACALFDAYAVCGDTRFLDAGCEALRYEQAQYSVHRQNWPDFRENNTPDDKSTLSYGLSWCHGAPGIALSRSYIADIWQSSELQLQNQAALDTTYRHTLSMSRETASMPNFSLCHGMCGNADILLESSNDEHRALAYTIGTLGIQRYHNAQLPWPGGISGNRETPGMMMGLAGIGYYYLRLSDPGTFATVLLPGRLQICTPA